MNFSLTQERRKYTRFALRLPAKMEVVGLGQSEVFHALTSNVSAGGAFFPLGRPFAKGVELRLGMVICSEGLMKLTGAQGLAKLEGTVVRRTLGGMAIRFDEKYEMMTLRKGGNNLRACPQPSCHLARSLKALGCYILQVL